MKENSYVWSSLQWRHNGHEGVSNDQPHDCLLKRLFRRRSKKTSKLRVTGLCAGNSPVTGEFPAQRASNGENVSIWWRHHAKQTRALPTNLHMSETPLISQMQNPYDANRSIGLQFVPRK